MTANSPAMELEDILMNPSSRSTKFPDATILVQKYLEIIGKETLKKYNIPYFKIQGIFQFKVELDAYQMYLFWEEYQITGKKMDYNRPILIMSKQKCVVSEIITSEFIEVASWDDGDGAFKHIIEHFRGAISTHCREQVLACYKEGIDPVKLSSLIYGTVKGPHFPPTIEVVL